MTTPDTCCTLVPYFKILEGNLSKFKALCEQFVERTKREKKCMFYGFSFHDNEAHCREGYQDAEGVLEHLDNVDSILQQALKLSELYRLEIHGPESELNKLREPLAGLEPKYYVLEYGFRR